MKVTIRELRRIIREVVESEMGAPRVPGRFENDIQIGSDNKHYQWINGKWIEASTSIGDDRSTENILGGGRRGRYLAHGFENRW